MVDSALGATSDFSAVAARYDETREIPAVHLAACYERLIRGGVLPATGVVLDAGCGTGQISLPLAALGYEVRGFDVSAAMVAIARAKCRRGWRARYAVADIRRIPERDNGIDAVVVSKLFQHVENWRAACRELLRVLKPGSCLVNVNERGAFGNAVRRQFAGRADALGHGDRYPGVMDRAQLAAFFLAEGCEQVEVDMTDLRWEKRISYGEALGHLRDRLHAEFWYLPEDVHQRVLDETERWVAAQPQGGETIQVLTPYLSAEVFRKPRE